jgi:phosphatidylethanolamine/phosphatidyl-N-methylethanolamine N-methyltransferase
MSFGSLSHEAVVATYARYARVYDQLFGWSLAAGRRAAVTQVDARPGEKVLEIGVGTGLSLGLYPPGVALSGVDLSQPMLDRARLRAERLRRPVELHCENAQALSFPDASFDHCVAMYVMSVAPDPVAVLREMRRVTKPGGRLVLVNHFSHRGTAMERLERAVAPLAERLGWEPLFYLDDFKQRCGLEEALELPVPPFGYWRVLVARRGA